MQLFFRLTAFTFLLTLVSACGSDPKTALVTLQTGLENRNPTKNLMNGLVYQLESNRSLSSSFCKQNDVLAGFGPSNNSGNDSNVSFFKFSLSTNAANSFGSNPDSWLASNTEFPPIGIPAPIGVPLDFGILGSLVAAPSASISTNGQLCPAANGATPYTNYSFIGHAQATISGNTVVPIKVWVIQSDGGSTPHNPGSVCNSSNGGDGVNAQYCPNKNYFLVKISSCAGASNLLFNYGYGNNGNPPVSQLVPCSVAMGNGIQVPSIKPLDVTLYNGTTPVGSKVTIDRSVMVGGIASLSTANSATLSVYEGGGSTTPGTVNISNLTASGGPSFNVLVTWAQAYLAVSYTVKRYAADCSTLLQLVTSNSIVFSIADTGVSSGTYCYGVKANGVNGTFGTESFRTISF